MADGDLVSGAEGECLTPQQHLEKADAALAAAKVAYAAYVESGRQKLDVQSVRLAEYLDLIQMVNVHANMANAKANVAIMEKGEWKDGSIDGAI